MGVAGGTPAESSLVFYSSHSLSPEGERAVQRAIRAV